MTDKTKDRNIEETLNSLDSISRATPGPYFFTRLQQRIKSEETSIWSTIALWISRPAIAFSVLTLVILLNLAVIFNQNAGPENLEENSDYYSMSSPNTLDDENPY